jgi:hypothetical protein
VLKLILMNLQNGWRNRIYLAIKNVCIFNPNIRLKQKMEKFKKKHYMIAGICLLFIITNPSRSAFASYLGAHNDDGIGRYFNGLIFSVYKRQPSPWAQGDGNLYYIGVLGNFFRTSN